MPGVIVVSIANQQSDALPVIRCFNVIKLFFVCSCAACPNHFDIDAEPEKYAQGMTQHISLIFPTFLSSTHKSAPSILDGAQGDSLFDTPRFSSIEILGLEHVAMTEVLENRHSGPQRLSSDLWDMPARVTSATL